MAIKPPSPSRSPHPRRIQLGDIALTSGDDFGLIGMFTGNVNYLTELKRRAEILR